MILKRVLLFFSFSALFLSCAVVEPPSGGPEDKTPASINEIFPSPDSSGVSRDIPVRLTFSEKIDEESFRKRIIFYPEIPFKDIKVDDNILEIVFEDELPETTICLFLKGGYMDAHGVKAKSGRTFCFSTSDSLDPGKISGYILLKGKLLPGGIAKLIDARVDSSTQYFRKKELRTSLCDESGRFVFDYLPVDSAGYRVWGFVDINGDGIFNEDKELSMLHEEPLYLTRTRPVGKSFTMNIIDPNEPGEVKGRAENLTGIDIHVTVLLDGADDDKRKYYSRADSTGSYSIPKVLPGNYILSAFLDIKADSLAGYYRDLSDSTTTRLEPNTVLPDTLKIGPGEKKDVPKITIDNK